MLAKVFSFALLGLEGYSVTIEVDVTPGLPATVIVGLPDNAVKESKERVRSAIKNSGFKFASQRITVNLAPANIRKEGPAFDLPIALGILAATGQIDSACFADSIILGELSLDGHLQPIRGSLPMALSINKEKYKGLIVPSANAKEAALANTVSVYGVKTLSQTVHFLSDPSSVVKTPSDIDSLFENVCPHSIDFCDVKGQWHVKRGLEIAAAGGHNILESWTQHDLHGEMFQVGIGE